MAYQGIDTATPLQLRNFKLLKANDISFVGRYLVPATPSMWKAITPKEIDIIHSEGLAILLCWEMGEGDMKEGSSKGIVHGSTARQLAEQYGVPEGTTIFFACDYNAQKEDFIQIEAYLQAAALALGDKYNIGLYGHNRVIDYIALGGIVKKFWQCVAWSGGQVSQFTNVYQYEWSGGQKATELAKLVGIDENHPLPVDLNSCQDMKAAGLWMPPEKEPESNWYDIQMQWCKDAGLLRDGRPNDPLTRAEAATILYRLYGPEDRKDFGGLGSDD